MNDKPTLDEAPEGAQYYGAGNYWGYVYGRGWCRHSSEGWVEQVPHGPLRSLTDIHRIVELEEENERLRKALTVTARY